MERKLKLWKRIFNNDVPAIMLFAIICISGMLVFSAVTQPAHQNRIGFEEGTWFDRWVYTPFMRVAGWLADWGGTGGIYNYQVPPAQDTPQPATPPCCAG